MKKTISNLGYLILIVMILFSSSCATIMGKRSKMVSMESYPSGADIYLNGLRVGTTPTDVSLNNRTNQTLEFKKDGFKPVGKTIHTRVGIGWVLADVLFGVWPIVIDAATGSWKRIDTKKVTVTLDKKDN